MKLTAFCFLGLAIATVFVVGLGLYVVSGGNRRIGDAVERVLTQLGESL